MASDDTHNMHPLLLSYTDHEHLTYLTSPPMPPFTTGDVHHREPSPTPSNSTVVWMGHPDDSQLNSSQIPAEGWMSFPGDVASTSAHSPITPTVIYWDAPYAIEERCICGCGGGPCIPQRNYDRHKTDPLSPQELKEIILFSVNGRCGYPLKNALDKRYTGLDGRDQEMFVESRSSISVRLEWLAYEKWARQIRTLSSRKRPEHITRSKLATELAKRMEAFFKEMQGKAANPSHLEYRVQPGIIDLEHLELVALQRVSKSSWMPHFRLIPSLQAL